MARTPWAGTAILALLAASSAWAKGPAAPSPATTPSAIATAAPTVQATVQATAQPTAQATVVPTLKPTQAAQASPIASTGTAKASAQASGLSATVQSSAKPVAVSGTAKPAAVSGTAQSTADHKSPALATLLAVVPGIAVHGAGHMYAGSWMKGLGLFAVEGACVAVGYDTVRRAMDSAKAQSDSGGIPTDLSPFYTDAGVTFVMGMGFLWTWCDDIAGAGIAVDEYNKKQDEAAALNAVHLQLLPAPGGAMLALSSRF